MTLFAWLGSLRWRETDGRPTRTVLWVSVILSGVIFGWDHIDDGELSNPTTSTYDLAAFMGLVSVFGVILGWLYWRLGLECAIFAHFLLDAVELGLVTPAYLSDDLLA